MDSFVEAFAGSSDLPGDARRLSLAASEVMDVRSVKMVAGDLSAVVGRRTPGGDPAVEIRGRFLLDSDKVYDHLVTRFKELGYVLLLRQRKGEHIVLGIPGELPKGTGRPIVAAVMFALTVVSTLFVGWGYAVGSGYAPESSNLLAGWPFSAALLGILLTHEMGHYVVARWQKLPASLPYFIPFPTILGTMGAVIQMQAPPKNKKALLLLGASGPLAGLVVAIPVLLLGLAMSVVRPISLEPGTMLEGNSLLYAALKFITFGKFLPGNGLDVWISPVAFAGWAGLLVTGMNLLPAGQLDGGHVAYALFGRSARWLTWAVVAVLAGLCILWQGWILFTALVLLFGRYHATPLDDVTPLGYREKVLAILTLIAFILVFIPIPMTLY